MSDETRDVHWSDNPRIPKSDYQDLRRTAERATPGPWRSADGGVVIMAGDVTDEDSVMVVDCADTSWADTQFIAEANPRVVLDLIAENARLLEENRALYAEQPKMQRDAWGEGYADGRDDTLEGVPGATSNPYTEEA